jgi:hypothetical protein
VPERPPPVCGGEGGGGRNLGKRVEVEVVDYLSDVGEEEEGDSQTEEFLEREREGSHAVEPGSWRIILYEDDLVRSRLKRQQMSECQRR